MNLLVHVIEARRLPAVDLNRLSDSYAKVSLGKRRAKTKVVKKTLNPTWDEEFQLRVGDITKVLTVSVYNEDKYFNDDFLGQIKIPLLEVFGADNRSLGATWYQLHPKSKKSKKRDCGEILLTISFSQKTPPSDDIPVVSLNYSDDLASNSDKSNEIKGEAPLSSSEKSTELKGDLSLSSSKGNTEWVDAIELAKEDKSNASSLADIFFQVFQGNKVEAALLDRRANSLGELQDILPKPEPCDSKADEASSSGSFDELLKIVESKDEGGEVPENLPGGVLLNQSYVIAPGDLNSLLFSPTSNFLQSMADLQRTTALQPEPWRLENGVLKRVMTYIKAASKLVKAVKATEEQTYLKADGKTYAVLASVSIPDVPCGSYFKTEILYCIKPGPELPSGNQSSHLLISWRLNFTQSTMMKGMIESGARQGLKESFAQFSDLLSQNVKLDDSEGTGSNKEQILSSLQMSRESDWNLTIRFFGNFTVLFSFLTGLYVLLHIILANPRTIHGLEFVGLDLPDSIEEVVACGILVFQGNRVLNMLRHYLQARKQRGSDHGVKAQGDGWLLTVALIEGTSLQSAETSGFSDPYVVFTCNGKTRTSSVKFQTTDPQWNEVFEFDAMADPPSRMDVVVYGFDGSFAEATCLGHAEVNFVKSRLSELSDFWIPLQGKFAQASQSKLHLRIFLNNTRGSEVVADYLTKIEKEVGKKISLRSSQTNSTFQKIFCLPPEEFLINDFTCHLKRKMPLQGRLFLSPRIIGFYANLFGNKTKFFFLWEDIDEIQIIPPTLATVGSPSLMVFLRKGRGMDARHGAKGLHWDGRLKFHFQSFVSFQAAKRIIMALWKARSSSPEQKVKIVEESETKSLCTEENVSFMASEDSKMSEIFFCALPVATDSLMDIFTGGPLECNVMERVGCADYTMTPWEQKSNVYQRQVNYKFDKDISQYGGEVTSTQQKSPLPDRNGWIVEEVMTLQGVLLGNFLSLQLKYQIENLPSKTEACRVQVFMGVVWLKNTKHRKRILKNIMSNSSLRLKEVFSLAEKELLQGKRNATVNYYEHLHETISGDPEC